MLRQQVKEELIYLLKNKLVILLVALICVTSFSYSMQDIDVLRQEIKQFQKDKNELYGVGDSFDEKSYNNDIKRKYNVQNESNSGNEVLLIDNVIAYDKAEVEKRIGFFYGTYIFHMSLNTMYSFFVLVIAVLGVIIITEDNENCVKRIKVSRIGKDLYFVGKLITGIICSFIMLIVSWIMVSMVYYMEYRIYISKNIAEFKPKVLSSKSDILMKISIMSLIAIFMLSVGILVGGIVKKSFVSIVVLVVYGIMVPIKWKYQSGISIKILSNRIFDNLSEVHTVYNIPYKISSYKAVFILLCYIVLTIFISYYINKKQSAY